MNHSRRTTLPAAAPTTHARRLTRGAVAALGLVGVLTAAACSSGTHDAGHPAAATAPSGSSAGTGTPGTPAAGAHGAADVAFATDMIPHHGQAVTMADLALAKSANDDVRQLATAIKGAQDPEIRTMSGWLAGWGEAVPAPDGDHAGHSGSMEGMMSAEQMGALESASGTTFDRLWLELMVEHHEGAVAMSRTALAAAENPEVKALAQRVIDGQTAEITTMRGLLAGLPG